jgi:hypothetical protein
MADVSILFHSKYRKDPLHKCTNPAYADTSLASFVCVKTKDVLNEPIVSLRHCEA